MRIKGGQCSSPQSDYKLPMGSGAEREASGKVTLHRVVGPSPKVTAAQAVPAEELPTAAQGAWEQRALVSSTVQTFLTCPAERTGLAEGRRTKEELWQVATLAREQRAINCLNQIHNEKEEGFCPSQVQNK